MYRTTTHDEPPAGQYQVRLNGNIVFYSDSYEGAIERYYEAIACDPDCECAVLSSTDDGLDAYSG